MKKLCLTLVAAAAMVVAACSGGKTENSAATVAEEDLVGIYTCTENSELTRELNADGTGVETSSFGSVAISVPFAWSVEGDVLTLDYDMSQFETTGDAESQVNATIVEVQRTQHSQPATLTVTVTDGTASMTDGVYEYVRN